MNNINADISTIKKYIGGVFEYAESEDKIVYVERYVNGAKGTIFSITPRSKAYSYDVYYWPTHVCIDLKQYDADYQINVHNVYRVIYERDNAIGRVRFTIVDQITEETYIKYIITS